MVLGHFAALLSGSSARYQKLLKENVHSSVFATCPPLNSSKKKVKKKPSQSLNLNPIEML